MFSNAFLRFVGRLLLALGLFGFVGCANVQPLVGGEKDITAPKIDSTKSSANNQVNFAGRSFELTFDEWIELKDPAQQVLVSPPLQYGPKITLRGKTVNFKLDEREVLKPDFTYVVNFGSAVKDLTEGNIPQELRFVFSTGAFIDSLMLIATVKDAQTSQPVPEALVLLYDNLTDTAWRKDKPLYFAKTSETGVCNLKNIRPGKYRMLAILDANNDYRYSSSLEAIAMAENFITIEPGVPQKLQLSLSQVLAPLNVQDFRTDSYGSIWVKTNRPAPNAQYRVRDEAAEIAKSMPALGDTLILKYSSAVDTAFQIIVSEFGKDFDTFAIKAIGREAFLKTVKLRAIGIVNELQSNKSSRIDPKSNTLSSIFPNAPLRLLFNHPLKSWQSNRFYIEQDSLGTLLPIGSIEADTTDAATLRIMANWPDDGKLNLVILPEAATSIYDQINTDTIRIRFLVPARKTLGDIVLKLGGLDIGTQYIVTFLDGENIISNQLVMATDSTWSRTYTAMRPATYTLRIEEDTNKNGFWDTFDPVLNRQPEKRYFKKLETLRANWTLEVQTSPTEMKDAGTAAKKAKIK